MEYSSKPFPETLKESSIVPVWITFPALPNHLYNKAALRILAKSLGTPLQMDDPTSNGTRPSHPRVCIEFDCLKAPPDQIFVHLRDRETGVNVDGFWQQVIFEKLPNYCTQCNILGHDKESCKIGPLDKNNRGKQADEKEKVSEAGRIANFTKEGLITPEVSQELEKNLQHIQQPLKKTSENFNTSNNAPFLTDNWEIGNRKKWKEGSNPSSNNLDGPSGIVSKNNFSVLDPQEKGQVSDLHLNQLNYAASLPGTSTFDEGESFRPKASKGLKPEDIVIVKDVLDDEDDSSPEPGILSLNLPEKKDISEKDSQIPIMSSHILPVSKDNDTDVGVAQGAETRVVAAQSSVLLQINSVPSEKKDGEMMLTAPNSVGPVCSNMDPVPLGHSSAHNTSPKATEKTDAQPLAQSLKSPEAQCKSGFVPKSISEERMDVPSGEHQSDSDIIDNWILSERKEERRKSELNKYATSYYPSTDWHNHYSSWIEDGEDTGPDFPQSERNLGFQGEDDLSEMDAGSEVSTYSEFREIDEEFEDDFTVHPPRKWNSTNNLQQMQFAPRLVPPVTRSRGKKLGKGKNKLRFE